MAVSFKKIGRWVINRKLKRRSKQAFDSHISKVNKVLIVVDKKEADSTAAFMQTVKFLQKNTQAEIKVLSFTQPKDEQVLKTNLPVVTATSKMFNWVGLPSDPNIKALLQSRYDAVLTLATQPNMLLVNLVAMAFAKLKVGTDYKPLAPYLDLVLNTEAEKGNKLTSFAKNLQHYLMLINQTTK